MHWKGTGILILCTDIQVFKKTVEKTYFKKCFFLNYKKIVTPEEIFSQLSLWVGNFWSPILHSLPLIYPILLMWKNTRENLVRLPLLAISKMTDQGRRQRGRRSRWRRCQRRGRPYSTWWRSRCSCVILIYRNEVQILVRRGRGWFYYLIPSTSSRKLCSQAYSLSIFMPCSSSFIFFTRMSFCFIIDT